MRLRSLRGRAEFHSRRILQRITGLNIDFASTLLDSRGWGWVLDQLALLAPQVEGIDAQLQKDLQEWARACQEPRVQRNIFLHGAMNFITFMSMQSDPPDCYRCARGRLHGVKISEGRGKSYHIEETSSDSGSLRRS